METQIKFSLGGGKRIRTADPLHAMQVLYQLSYTPERENALYLKKITNANFSFHIIQDFLEIIVLNKIDIVGVVATKLQCGITKRLIAFANFRQQRKNNYRMHSALAISET